MGPHIALAPWYRMRPPRLLVPSFAVAVHGPGRHSQLRSPTPETPPAMRDTNRVMRSNKLQLTQLRINFFNMTLGLPRDVVKTFQVGDRNGGTGISRRCKRCPCGSVKSDRFCGCSSCGTWCNRGASTARTGACDWTCSAPLGGPWIRGENHKSRIIGKGKNLVSLRLFKPRCEITSANVSETVDCKVASQLKNTERKDLLHFFFPPLGSGFPSHFVWTCFLPCLRTTWTTQKQKHLRFLPGGGCRDARDGRHGRGDNGGCCDDKIHVTRSARRRARDYLCCRWSCDHSSTTTARDFFSCDCSPFTCGSDGARDTASSGSGACHTRHTRHAACGHGQSVGHHGSGHGRHGRHGGCHGVTDGRRGRGRGRAGDGGGDGGGARRGRGGDGGFLKWSKSSKRWNLWSKWKIPWNLLRLRAFSTERAGTAQVHIKLTSKPFIRFKSCLIDLDFMIWKFIGINSKSSHLGRADCRGGQHSFCDTSCRSDRGAASAGCQRSDAAASGGECYSGSRVLSSGS